MKAPEQIRAWLEGRGSTIVWLAKQIPMSQEHLSRCLNGKHKPSMMARARIETITGLNVSPDDMWSAQ